MVKHIMQHLIPKGILTCFYHLNVPSYYETQHSLQ